MCVIVVIIMILICTVSVHYSTTHTNSTTFSDTQSTPHPTTTNVTTELGRSLHDYVKDTCLAMVQYNLLSEIGAHLWQHSLWELPDV